MFSLTSVDSLTRHWDLADGTEVTMTMVEVYQTRSFLLQRSLTQREADNLYMQLVIGKDNQKRTEIVLRPIYEAWQTQHKAILAYTPPPG